MVASFIFEEWLHFDADEWLLREESSLARDGENEESLDSRLGTFSLG